MKLRIDTIAAYVSLDQDGNEGVCAFYDSERSTWMPLIGADEDRIKSMRPVAEDISKTTGRPIRLVRFTERETLDLIEPNTEKRPG